MRRITGCSHSKSNSVSMWNATFDSWQIIWWANDGGAALCGGGSRGEVRRSSPSRGVTEQGRMLQAKAEAAGALCGTGRAPRCGRAVGVAALAWRGAAVNAQRWPRSCASSCARQSGAIHYACANWCGPARSRGGACRAIIANSSSAAALRRKPLLTWQCCSSIVLLFLAAENEA